MNMEGLWSLYNLSGIKFHTGIRDRAEYGGNCSVLLIQGLCYVCLGWLVFLFPYIVQKAIQKSLLYILYNNLLNIENFHSHFHSLTLLYLI